MLELVGGGTCNEILFLMSMSIKQTKCQNNCFIEQNSLYKSSISMSKFLEFLDVSPNPQGGYPKPSQVLRTSNSSSLRYR